MLEKEILELCSKDIKDQEKLVKLKDLVKRGANVNAKDKEGGTPLNTVSGHGNLECVKFLLQSGADLEEHDNEQSWDALNVALECCKNETAKYLAIEILNKHGIAIQHNEPEEVIKYKLLTLYLYGEQHETFSDKQKIIDHCLSPFFNRLLAKDLLAQMLGQKSSATTYCSSAQVFGSKETKIDPKALEADADDSSDDDEDFDWEQDSSLKKSCEEFKITPTTPKYMIETDPESYSYLVHIMSLEKLHSKEVNQHYRALKRKTLPPTKCLASNDTLVAWVKSSIIDLLKNIFSVPETQALAAKQIWNAFNQYDQWLTQASLELVTKHNRVLFKQMNSHLLLKEVVCFVLTVQHVMKAHINSCEEKLQIQDPSCFPIDDFERVVNDIIENWLHSNHLVKLNKRFLSTKDRVGHQVDAKDDIDRQIYEEFKNTDGVSTLNTFCTRTRAQTIFNLICQKEINKGDSSLIVLTARGYAFKTTTTKTQLEQSDFKKLFYPPNFEALTKKYLPYNAQRLKDELSERTALQVTPFKFVETLKKQRKLMGVSLERGLPPQQYTFESKSNDGYYANLRLAMRFQKRRIRHGADNGTQEEVFQAAWRLGKFPYAALEEQSIGSNGSRSDLVSNLSSYPEINNLLQKYPNYHKQIASWINEFLFLDNDRLDTAIAKENVVKQDIFPLKKLIINLTYLLLGCEVQRNPAALVTNRMALQLIQAGELTWQNALAKPESKEFCAGGEMPMSMGKYKATKQRGNGEVEVGSDPVKCARVLQKHYGLFAVKPWRYEGELANENSTTRDHDHIVELIRRENAVVKKWLILKKLNNESLEKQIAAIKELINPAPLEEKAESVPTANL